MDFFELMNGIVSFAQNNKIIVIVLAVGLLFFMYRKPKHFFVLLVLGLFLAGVFHMVTRMADSGLEKKKGLIRDGEKRSQNTP